MKMEKCGKLLVMLLVKQKITCTLKKYHPMAKLLTDKKLIANELNQYFNTIPTKTQSDLDPSLHIYDNLVPANEWSMFMKQSSPAEIVNVITKL